jgi:hypothetical protein
MNALQKLTSIFEIKSARDAEAEMITAEINQVVKSMKNLDSRFNLQDDYDLIESEIYELCALKARYRYLLKKARMLAVTEAEAKKEHMKIKGESECRNIG